MDDIQPKRRWYQFGLRTFFLGILVIAIGCGLFAVKLQAARKQRTTVAMIREWGGDVDYTASSAPDWMMRWLGEDFFCMVTRVHVDKAISASDEELAQLEPFTDVECLYANRMSITDAALAHFRGMTKLGYLYLNRACITDAGLKDIAAFSRLRELDLSKTQVSDAGLQSLTGLKHLKLLDLRNTNVTAAGVAELKEALPELIVIQQ
jgi:hypothetical protein